MIDVVKYSAFTARRWMAALPRDRLRRAANVLMLSVTACAVVAVLGLATTLLLVPRVLDLQNLVIATGSMSPALNAATLPSSTMTFNPPTSRWVM